MDPKQWARLKPVLDEANGLAGVERERLVERFSADNPELRDELRSLLNGVDAGAGAQDSLTTELASPVHDLAGEPDSLPERIGPYRVVSKLGEGGMGVVYEAEQANPRRRVAVKVIRGGRFVDELWARSFQREANTLALLKHPGIGAIFESGRTEDGAHFFAMELVRGVTLDKFLAGRSEIFNDGEVRFRLSLFRKIADAVQHAHQRGVIHRDLKPANILITAEASRQDDAALRASRSGEVVPEIKILDFGLARITDGDVAAVSMTTEIGLIKGTLAYMSPEQALGNPDRIDLRCDVYALGVILYEMLCGYRPYDVSRKSIAEAVRVICEQPPVPLRHHWGDSGRLDPDVETIVGRALEKDVERRYSSTAALSDDVSRYLTSQPILARPPSTIYHLRKFAARNRALVGGVVTTFVVLIAGIVVSTVFGLREATQRRQADAARNDLQAVAGFQAAMLRNVDAQKLGQGLQHDLIERMASVTGADELAVVERSFAHINTTDAALRILDEDILARAAASIAKEFAQRPLIAAQLYLSLAETYRILGLLPQAEQYVTRAIEIRRRELGPDDVSTLWARLTLSSVLERQGRLAESEASSRRVLEAAQRTVGEKHDLTLRTKNLLATVCDRQNRYDEAEQLYQSVYDAMSVVRGDDDREVIWLVHNLGSVRRLAGRPAEAEPLLSKAVAAGERVFGPDHHDTVWFKLSLAFAYQALGQFKQAESLAADVLEKRRRLMGSNHQETIEATTLLGAIYLEEGRITDAELVLRDAVDRARKFVGNEHRESLWAMTLLAQALDRQGRSEQALPLLEEAYEGRRRALGDADPWTSQTRRELIEVLKKLGRHADAQRYARPTDGQGSATHP